MTEMILRIQKTGCNWCNRKGWRTAKNITLWSLWFRDRDGYLTWGRLDRGNSDLWGSWQSSFFIFCGKVNCNHRSKIGKVKGN